MRKRAVKYAGAILLFTSIFLLFIFLFVAKLPDVPLEFLFVDTEILPPGWIISRTLSPSSDSTSGNPMHLFRDWVNDEVPSDVGPTTWMRIRKYKYPAEAIYSYNLSTSRAILPQEVYYTLENLGDTNAYAEQGYIVCTWPNAGDKCRAVGRYRQYVITFQFDFYGQPREEMESDFQKLWEEVDRHIGESLNQAQK